MIFLKLINRLSDWIILGVFYVWLFRVEILLVYVGVFFIFILVMMIKKRDLKTALFYGLLLALPFERGIRGWDYQVVSAGPESYVKGYEMYLGISPKIIIGLSLFLALLAEKWKMNRLSKQVVRVMLLILGLGLLSSFQASAPGLALIGWWQLSFITWVLIVSVLFFTKKENRIFLVKYLTVSLIFFGLIGSLQFTTKQPLGLFLENPIQGAPFGWLTNESKLVYRVAGLIGHPTFFASLLSLFFPLAVSGLVWGREKFLYGAAVVLGFISIFATFSRSAWITVFLTSMVLSLRWWQEKKKLKNRKIKSSLLIKIVLGNLVSFLIFFASLLQVRIRSFKYIWSLGSGRGRLLLFREAFKQIVNFPFLGVGLNNSVRVMRESSSNPEVLGLLFPVHNTFVLFLAEMGVVAGLLFIGLVGFVLIRSYQKAIKSWQGIGIYLGLVSWVINAQFHTLFNSDTSLAITMVLIGWLLNL